MRIGIAVVLVLLSAAGVAASSGDRRSDFNVCVGACNRVVCANDTDGAWRRNNPWSPAWSLALLQWTCDENCKYDCMWNVTNKAVAEGKEIEQFYGKWPFVRILGVQEPASLVFSVGNFLGHLYGLSQIYIPLAPASYAFKKPWIVYGCIAMNVWVWSSVFHARDTPWTERLDYFSGTLGIFFAIWVAVCRIFKPQRRVRIAIGMLMSLYYIAHVLYLSLKRFDYGYNMKVSIICGFFHSVLWCTWHAYYRRPYGWRVVGCALWISAAMALEVLDFAPIYFLIDAHSLWHAATIPVCVWWYMFLTPDAEYEYKRKD